jgi:flavin reductase (DIM6/NTAB) family NADH-FMN oxidoreductase RutF
MIFETAPSLLDDAYLLEMPFAFRRAAALLPVSVCVVSTSEVALIVSSLQVVSWEPPIVSICIDKSSRRGASVLASPNFHIRLLRNSEEDVVKGASPKGLGMVELYCTPMNRISVGDHFLVLASVDRVLTSDGAPMVHWCKLSHALRHEPAFLQSVSAFDDFIAAWLAGSLPKSEWTHAAHVAVAAYYCGRERCETINRLRTGIRRYNEATGNPNTTKSGYHETLTIFWAMLVSALVRGISSPLEAARLAVQKFGHERDLHKLYYSYDIVRDADARLSWVQPDLHGPLPLDHGLV